MANLQSSQSEAQNGSKNGGEREVPATREAVELTPPVDIYENKDELLLVADLPGVGPDDVSIDYDAPELRIRARREQGFDGAAQYFRAFRVDERIDPNGIEAELKDGVLFVHLKKSEDLRPRRVEVKSS
jgi:HSP20 family protein